MYATTFFFSDGLRSNGQTIHLMSNPCRENYSYSCGKKNAETEQTFANHLCQVDEQATQLTCGNTNRCLASSINKLNTHNQQ